MKIYLVGGAVRDKLLGMTPKDLDYVVVGSTPQEMLSLGYKQVGSNFPVFLHPETGDEYALARTEESTGVKYQDFNCYFGENVTLEEDLKRRDLTINAIAQDMETGQYVDPFQGIIDINSKVLRHTSRAFREDPVRLLRLVRFYSQFGSEWTVHKDTQSLCVDMLCKGYFKGLTPERVWKETEKALGSTKPSLYFKTLYDFSIFPLLDQLYVIPQKEDHHPEGNVGIHTEMVVDYAAKYGGDKEVLLACLLHDLGKYPSFIKYGNAHGHEDSGLPLIKEFCETYKVPNNYRDLALMVCKHHTKIHGMFGRNNQSWTRPKSIMNLFTETNALVKTGRFIKVLQACVCDARGRGISDELAIETGKLDKSQSWYEAKSYDQFGYLVECLDAVKDVDTKEISRKLLDLGKSGVMIGEQIRVARINAIRGVQQRWKDLGGKYDQDH